MINDDLKSRENSMPGSGISRRDFIKVTAGSVTCFSLSSWMLGCVTHDSGFAQITSYPIDSDVYTTLDRTIKPEPTSGAILPNISTGFQNTIKMDMVSGVMAKR